MTPQTALAARAAQHVLGVTKQPLGHYSAAELNRFVAAWPDPAQALALMKLSPADAPILFQDVSIADCARELLLFIETGEAPWPVFYMPTSRMEGWAADPEALALLALLHAQGLDVQLTISGPATWLRGHWVILCDMRLRFMAGVELIEEGRLATLIHHIPTQLN